MIGLSGGPDSVCLFDLILKSGFPAIGAHFDHQLRPGSGKEADAVQALVEDLGGVFVRGCAEVATQAREKHLSIEEAARNARYSFLFNTARELGAQAVVVGHTADDQVETVLMHLLRGSGLAGLKGMVFRSILPVWDDSIPLIRPLLATWRKDTLNYCSEHSLPVLHDPSNQDPAFFRNRLRHELIPFLQAFNPQVKERIWKMADVLQGDAQTIEASFKLVWEDVLIEENAACVSLSIEKLRRQSIGERRSSLRAGINRLLPGLRDLDYDTVERACKFVAAPSRSGEMDLFKGLTLTASAGKLYIHRAMDGTFLDLPHLDNEGFMTLQIPGQILLPGGWKMEAGPVTPFDAEMRRSAIEASQADPMRVWLDAARLGDGLHLRRPRPGDRFQPLGISGRTQKISDFFINAKLPRQARAGWPLLCCGEEIAWIPGFRPSDAFKLGDETTQAVRFWVVR